MKAQQIRPKTLPCKPLSGLLAALLLLGSLAACDQAAKLKEGSETSTLDKTQVAEDVADDFQLIARRILPAVVSISTQSARQRQLNRQNMPNDPLHQQQQPDAEDGLGSGVIVDAEKGYVLTNNHVIEGAEKIQIALQNGRRMSARLVGSDPATDLAVLQLQSTGGLKAAVLGDSSRLRIGEWVLAIGSPFGLDSTVTAGIISAKGRSEIGVADFEDFIQTDAAINPGNSGGPLVNTQGELIGLNTAIATRTTGYMGIGFAIPSNMAKKVMQELVSKGKVTRSLLGVYIGPIDEDLRQALKLSVQQQGILVMQVIPQTPAAEVGFQKYDVITTLNDQPVSQVSAFRNQIALTPPGRQMAIGILRNGKPLTLRPLLRENQGEAATPPDTLPKRLGFTLQEIPAALRQQLGLPESFNGLAVTSVSADSPAARRGIKPGDIVTEVNQKAVANLAEVAAAIKDLKPGDAVLISILREGQTRILAFELLN